jgi:hypothetical protein
MHSRIPLGSLGLVFAAGLLLGCMAGTQPAPAEGPSPASSAASAASSYGGLLLIDRTDLRLGTTVQFRRIPDLTELHDLEQVYALAHVVLALEEWPRTYAQIQPLEGLPEEADLVVIVRGYPPTSEAANAWNLLNTRVRLVMLVDGPPASTAQIAELNSNRALERVIAEMEYPSRSGFERLQRPLSFRKVMN